MIANFANPSLTPDGLHVPSGSGVFTIDRVATRIGWIPVAASTQTILFNGGTPSDPPPAQRGTWAYDLVTGGFVKIDPLGYGQLAAGHDQWIGCVPGKKLVRVAQPVLSGRYFDPSVDSDDGTYVWKEDGGVGKQRIVVQRPGETPRVVATGPYGEPRVRHGVLLYRHVKTGTDLGETADV